MNAPSRLPPAVLFAGVVAIVVSLGPLASGQQAELAVGAALDPTGAQLSRFGAGSGPALVDGVYRVLDEDGSFGQSTAVAFDAPVEGARESFTLRGRLRVDAGGDGGAFLFLDTGEYGARGPAPHLPSWVEPNLRRSFAVGIDVHDPPTTEPFGTWGNYQGLPEREVSLHWDGRELVKRVAGAEFRGDGADLEIAVAHVSGGAEVSVAIGDAQVYDRFFVPGLLPYEMRPAFGAGTRPDLATRFDVADLGFEPGPPAAPRRPPLHVEVFNHVLTDNTTTWYEREVDLPPAGWQFGRVILTLDIHDAGPDWDEWDRNGHLYLVDDDGTKWDLLPFITSYRTECHWEVDVTHFRPWLSGRRRLQIHAGTSFYKDRGYMLSVSLDFHHGEPRLDGEALEPYEVVPLWHTTAKYRNDENHFADAFEEQRVAIPAETVAARVATTTTGHSQVGEFTPSERAIVYVPDVDATAAAAGPGGASEHRFANTLWKSDCYLNPNRPQFGTWKYSRAGWAPGDVVHPWWVDLTPHLQPGATAALRYEPQPYDFSELPEERRPSAGDVGAASHVVRSYLVLYRTPTDNVPAPILRIANVAGDSAAARAGLKVGDYLASYDGVRVDSVEDLGAAKQAATDAGKQRVTVAVYRGTERLELELATGQMGVNLGAR